MKFFIRDLVWLTLVAAIGAGWFADRRHLQMRHEVEIEAKAEAVAMNKIKELALSMPSFSPLAERRKGTWDNPYIPD